MLLLSARHEVMAKGTMSVRNSTPRSFTRGRSSSLPARLGHPSCSFNHPSGDPEPSEEDLTITKRPVEAGDLLGIGVLDHVIIASRGVVSFRSRQLL